MHSENNQEDSILYEPRTNEFQVAASPHAGPNQKQSTAQARESGNNQYSENLLTPSVNLKFTSSLKTKLSNPSNKSALIQPTKQKPQPRKDAERDSATSSQKASPTARQKPLADSSVGELLGVKSVHMQKLLANYKNSGTFSVKKDSGPVIGPENESSIRGDYTSRTMFHVPKFITSSVGQTATMSSTLKISNTAGIKDRKGKATHRRTFSDTNSLSYHNGQRVLNTGRNNFNKTSMTSRAGKLSTVISNKHHTLKSEYNQQGKQSDNLLGQNGSTGFGPSKVPPFKQMNLQLKLKKEQPTCNSYRLDEDLISYEPESGARFITTEYLKKTAPKVVNMVSQTVEANISMESENLRQAEELIAQLRLENQTLRHNCDLQQKVNFDLEQKIAELENKLEEYQSVVVASNISIFFDKGAAKAALKTQPTHSATDEFFETKTSISGNHFSHPNEKLNLKTQVSETSSTSISKNLISTSKKSALRIKLPSHSLYSQSTPKGDGLISSSKKIAKNFTQGGNK